MARNLQLARRETFFNDPFFADIMSLQDNDLHKKLDVFKQKSLLGVGKTEAAHNLQVTASNDKFMVQLELPGFAPEGGPKPQPKQVKYMVLFTTHA